MNVQIKTPVISIWYNPRGAIRSILDRYPQWITLALCAMFGMLIMLPLSVAPQALLGPISKERLIRHGMWAVPLMIVVAIYLQGAMVTWSSRRAGSDADAHEIRTALAFARIPMFSWFIILAIAERSVLAWRAVHPGPAPMAFGWFLFASGGALFIWSIALRRACLSEVGGIERHQQRYATRLRSLAYFGAVAAGAIGAAASHFVRIH